MKLDVAARGIGSRTSQATIITPPASAIVECGIGTWIWTGLPAVPYSVAIFGPDLKILKLFPQQLSNLLNWRIDLPSGTNFSLRVEINPSGGGISSPFTVIKAGADRSCINTGIFEIPNVLSASPTSSIPNFSFSSINTKTLPLRMATKVMGGVSITFTSIVTDRTMAPTGALKSMTTLTQTGVRTQTKAPTTTSAAAAPNINGTRLGAIIGGVFAAVVALLFLSMYIFYALRRRNREHAAQLSAAGNASAMESPTQSVPAPTLLSIGSKLIGKRVPPLMVEDISEVLSNPPNVTNPALIPPDSLFSSKVQPRSSSLRHLHEKVTAKPLPPPPIPPIPRRPRRPSLSLKLDSLLDDAFADIQQVPPQIQASSSESPDAPQAAASVKVSDDSSRSAPPVTDTLDAAIIKMLEDYDRIPPQTPDHGLFGSDPIRTASPAATFFSSRPTDASTREDIGKSSPRSTRGIRSFLSLFPTLSFPTTPWSDSATFSTESSDIGQDSTSMRQMKLSHSLRTSTNPSGPGPLPVKNKSVSIRFKDNDKSPPPGSVPLRSLKSVISPHSGQSTTGSQLSLTAAVAPIETSSIHAKENDTKMAVQSQRIPVPDQTLTTFPETSQISMISPLPPLLTGPMFTSASKGKAKAMVQSPSGDSPSRAQSGPSIMPARFPQGRALPRPPVPALVSPANTLASEGRIPVQFEKDERSESRQRQAPVMSPLSDNDGKRQSPETAPRQVEDERSNARALERDQSRDELVPAQMVPQDVSNGQSSFLDF